MIVCHTMHIAHHRSLWLRASTFLWVSSWLVLLPLVHVHPEIEHHHGDLGHVHHTVMHTVFAGALESEDFAENATGTSSLGDHQHSATIGINEPTTSSETEYPLLAAFIAPTIQKLLLEPSSLIEDCPSATPVFVSERTAIREVAPSLRFLSAALPLRAPPVFFS
jgi:hypothetical protein